MQSELERKRKKTAERLHIAIHGVPRHLAIIMDGNGRWAIRRGMHRFEGHRQGARIVELIVKHSVKIGIEYLTIYAFSMQNWKRSKQEVDFLMHLYAEYLIKMRGLLMEDNVRLVHLGRRNELPRTVRMELAETVNITSDNTGMVLGFALNYASRAEITEAIKKIVEEYQTGELKLDSIDQQCLSDHLCTAGWCDPDLLIRTSGEMRMSNFLLWQISYTEFFVTDTLWPDFDTCELEKAIKIYAKRSRRFGAYVS